MKLGYIGLGKMGANMVELIIEKGHKPAVFDIDKKAVQRLSKKGALGADSIKELVLSQPSPRLIWIMVPYKLVDDILKNARPYLKRGDIIVDGGNSPFQESIRRAKNFKKKGIHYFDIGVSGGPGGARKGACMMVGGGSISL